jgi:hypothetical protein
MHVPFFAVRLSGSSKTGRKNLANSQSKDSSSEYRRTSTGADVQAEVRSISKIAKNPMVLAFKWRATKASFPSASKNADYYEIIISQVPLLAHVVLHNFPPDSVQFQ